jgi:hypothetical protein
MGVLDGQPVSAAITNPAFINKNISDIMPNQLGFNRPLSGPDIADIQAAVNKLYTATGASESGTGTIYDATPGTITNGTSYESALTLLADKFDAATGHSHSGADGDGGPLAVVTSLAASGYAGLVGDVVIAGGSGAQVYESGGQIFIAATGHVDSIASFGNSQLNGNVVLSSGTGIQMTQVGQTITVAASGAVGGGGGGGGSLQWVEGLSSPTPILEYSNDVYVFDAALSQQLTTACRVPNGYVAGSQVRLRALIYSSDTTGNLLFQTVSTLIRTGTDAITSTTNQRTSTNSAITLSAGTVNIPQAVVFDISSSIGQINGVALSAGDLILITFKRGTDTSTVAARALVFASELNFS